MLADLNEQQIRAVTHEDDAILVLAGAGSGKTSVLTTRIAWLMNVKEVSSQSILAVTFTNKAAKEMLARINLNATTRNMWVGTFHSISLRMLRSNYVAASLPSTFQVIDPSEQMSLAKRLIRSANLDEDSYPPKEFVSFINNCKEQGLRASDLNPNSKRSQDIINLYNSYEQTCNRDGLVDFTELLLRCYELLSTNPNILKQYHDQFKHILIDEFQDTNPLQYKWVKLLVGENTKIFAVGDDDQSIYAFRGAKVANMQSFIKDFDVHEPIKLEQNYRSTPMILDAANALIANNEQRIGKKLWTQNEFGEKIKFYEGYTEEDEAYYVADEIKSLSRNGIDLNEIAILYRSNAQSRVFEQMFYNRGVNYRVYGGLRFFDRQEIKIVIGYLRLLVNTDDNEAFLRVVNFPMRGIGAKAVENLQQASQIHGVSLFRAVNFLEGKLRERITKFTQLIHEMQQAVKGLDLAETVSYVIEYSGMHECYTNDKKDGLERIENLNELIASVANYKKSRDDVEPLVDFLSQIVVEATEINSGLENSAVQLMTVHSAKGLEFKVVFIVGLEDGLFPHENALKGNQDIEEERRLMYVAITRSRERLYLVRACSRMLWGKRSSAPLSRFVNEIPSQLINNLTGITRLGSEEYTEHSDSNKSHLRDLNPETKISRVSIKDKGIVVKIGDMVMHRKFGDGKILRLNVDGGKSTAEIFFVGIGKKMLDLSIAPIEVVN